MLDHVFTDAIGALRDALEAALLERMSPDEHFQLDVLTGDTTWETSYGLPGEGTPPRVRADITLDWPTWSQSAFRSWLRSEETDEPPRIEISVVLRLQDLSSLPTPSSVMEALPNESAPIGGMRLARTAPTVETAYTDELVATGHAMEFGFEGEYELDDKALTDGSQLDDHFSAMGTWIASMLVRLGDLPLEYRT
ncbi:hypothetical protein [Actinospongicola halichondriae]|uniref:hypothetical protein n=1 Tax=Actinospongicola halichondriae TaxID=3236844 RepID=UPI003D3A0762